MNPIARLARIKNRESMKEIPTKKKGRILWLNLVGQRFHRWTVLSKGPGCFWLCRCDCGTKKLILQKNLRFGYSKSCGCLQVETVRKNETVHGYATDPITGKPHPFYRAWLSMIGRCRNPRDTGWSYYGVRGIKVCKRFLSFVHFLADMRDGWKPGLTLDLKDNNGHYSCGKCSQCIEQSWPSNCRWATKLEQANNKRNNRRITFGNITKTAPEWARSIGISAGTFSQRLDRGWTAEKAITTPLIKH